MTIRYNLHSNMNSSVHVQVQPMINIGNWHDVNNCLKTQINQPFIFAIHYQCHEARDNWPLKEMLITNTYFPTYLEQERSERGVATSRLIGGTVLRQNYPLFSRKTASRHDWKTVDSDIKHKHKQINIFGMMTGLLKISISGNSDFAACEHPRRKPLRYFSCEEAHI